MRIMLDTNILISIVIFNSDILKEMLVNICDKHTLVLSSFIIDELKSVIDRKFPDKKNNIDEFLLKLPYILENTQNSNVILNENSFNIRDKNDIPILYSAIVSNVDIFITGDKDFCDVNIKRPKIMTVRQFLNNY